MSIKNDKKLEQLSILSMEQEAYKRKEIKVKANGEEYSVCIDEKFKDTEIATILTELVKRSEHAKKESLNFDITGHLLILLIKHFTDIQFQETGSIGKDMDIEVRTLNALINLGIFEQIVERFDKAEVSRISEMIKKHQKGLKAIANNIMAMELKSDEELV